MYYTMCMYVYYTMCMYVCSSVVCVLHSVRARPPPPACAACVGVPVLTYCIHVVSVVVAMGSPCRTYVVCGVVYVSIVSLGCAYCSRCVLLLIIVCTKK